MPAVAALVSLAVAVIANITAFFIHARGLRNEAYLQEQRLRSEFQLQQERLRTELRTEFMAEEAVKKLLSVERWKKRSFDEIKKRVAGFEDNELRKLLVRSGAVRFEGGNGGELWGLRERNEDEV